MQALLDLGDLRIEAARRPSEFDDWFDITITVSSPPFGGVISAILTRDDLLAFADSLERLEVPGEVLFGGGRAPEVRLIAEQQVGGSPGRLAIECYVTPSGDDPFPQLRFLMFDVDLSSALTAHHVRTIANAAGPHD